MDEIVTAFETAQPGPKVEVSYGASGSLTAQIQQGAPFDLFLSADMDYPTKAAGNGAGRGEVFAYARGRLVLWVRKDLGLDPSLGPLVLKDARIHHIALANPRLAPYGAAAEATLRPAGMWEALQPKLAFGGNIAQTAQYLQVGAAEAGFIAASEAHHPALRDLGLTWIVPESMHPPLIQGGVLLSHGAQPARAAAFVAYLRSEIGQAILARFDFGKP